jgi:WD40 repeat protein
MTAAIFKGRRYPVGSVTFNATGQRFASACEDGMVRIWNTETGQLQSILKGHTKAVQTVVFDPSKPDCCLSGGADGTIRCWQISADDAPPVSAQSTEIQLDNGPAHPNKITTLAFTANGQMLASGSMDKTIKLWQAGALETTLVGHTLAVKTLAFHPSLPILASGGDDSTVRIWSIHSGTNLLILRQHTQAVQTLVFSPQGDLLATAGADRTIQIWDTQSWQLRQTLAGHSWPVSGLAWVPIPERHGGVSALLLSASWDTKIKVWHPHSGQELGVWQVEQEPILCLAMAPTQDWLATGNRLGEVRRWPLATFLARLL